MEKVPSKKWGPEQEISAATALCLCSGQVLTFFWIPLLQ